MRRIFILILCLALVIGPVQAGSSTKYVALTFDDGPSGRFTRRLLDGLAERDVKATFLLCGYRLKDYPNEAQRIMEEGHEIGLHGYSHGDMCAMTQAQVEKELRDTRALLPAGCAVTFMRPPGGSCGDHVQQAAKNQGVAILSWSLDPKDWATRDVSLIVRRVTEQVSDGDVILMHDMTDSSVTAALRIIDILTDRGYVFVTASQLAEIKGIHPHPGAMYCRFDDE
ncbi:MAG: polysaccharide deacetylase family protein [Oscillospiraceae bacterium]|nr:polysaccharide deacetylase family protein [Oscillospiraceae bacterium]